jgi:TDG/mug DNA glycosylase family protein
LGAGVGITNLVNRTTTAAADLGPAELAAGARALERKVRRFRPRTVAFLGMGAFRVAFKRPRATAGRQAEPLGTAVVWVLPNPSGLQAAYGMEEVVAQLRSLRASLRGDQSEGPA